MKNFLWLVFSFYFSSFLYASDHSIHFEEVAPGIFVHQGEHLDVDETYHGDIANIGFIVGEEAIAVVDTGGSLEIGRELELAIKKISNLPIAFSNLKTSWLDIPFPVSCVKNFLYSSIKESLIDAANSVFETLVFFLIMLPFLSMPTTLLFSKSVSGFTPNAIA